MNAALPLEHIDLTPFEETVLTAASHFRLALLGVVAHVLEACAEGGATAALDAHPFLADYSAELVDIIGEGEAVANRWRDALRRWESRSSASAPLLALRRAGVSDLELELLLAAGLIEEDPRFGELFEQGPARERRPTLLMLLAWWRRAEPDADGARDALQRLIRLGLLQVTNPDAPRPDWVVTVPAPVWDALRGAVPHLPWLQYTAHVALPQLQSYVFPDPVSETAALALPRLLHAHPEHMILLRGPARNGRRTLAGAVARALGRSLLIVNDADEPHWLLASALAVMFDGVLAATADLAAGEQRALPSTALYRGPVFVVAGPLGAIVAASGMPAITVRLPLPAEPRRLSHWRAALPAQSDTGLEELANRFRLGAGSIRRVATAAASLAWLEGRETVESGDIRAASAHLATDRLETLAARVAARGAWQDLIVDDPTRTELDALLTRCRFREPLAERAPAFARENVGVRALFAGPSGTGKTLAACLLAAELGKELYRVDLAATVNKYVGETEKNLNRAFSAAEELDVVLLLDEGDALMAARTDVSSANDRYANLETNFLLQRIEAFTGILLVTSNAADRIDKAFARRMDVVIPFRVPDEWRRFEILQRHLNDAIIDAQWLQEVACRCALTGGQLRNLVGHARLLALRECRAIQAPDLHAALVREYRKTGAACPLRAPSLTEC